MRKLFRRDPIVLGVLCGLLGYLPYRLFDSIDVIWLVAVVLVLVVTGWRVVPRFRRHLVLALVLLIVLATGGEVTIRLKSFGRPGLSLWDYRPAAYGNPFCNLEADLSTYTGLKAGQEAMFKTTRFRVNERGFRGPTYPASKPDGVYRIVIAGASATVGSGVKEADRFSSLLESGLNTEGDLPLRVEVINISVPGAHIGNHVHVVREEGLRLDPDLVMIQVNEAKSSRKPLVLSAKKIKVLDVGPFELVNNCRYEMFRSKFFFARVLLLSRRGKLYFNRSTPQWTSLGRLLSPRTPSPVFVLTEDGEAKLAQAYAPLIEGLESLCDLCEGRQIALYRLKPLETAEDPGRDWAYGEFMRRQAKRLGMQVVDTYDVDMGGRSVRDLVVYPGDTHPNATVHRIYAEHMLPQVREIVAGSE